VALAPSPYGAEPVPLDLDLEALQTLHIPWHAIIIRVRVWVLICYHFDYEAARIWRSRVLETSRHDLSVQRPFQVFGGATWAGSVPGHVVPDQAETRANSCAAV